MKNTTIADKNSYKKAISKKKKKKPSQIFSAFSIKFFDLYFKKYNIYKKKKKELSSLLKNK